MKIVAAPAVVAGLWKALQRPTGTPRTEAVARRATQVVIRGWAYRYEVQDLLSEMGADWWWQDADLNALFDLPVRTVLGGPRRSSTVCSGEEATSAADLTGMVLTLERLGLDVDPMPIVDAILPTLTTKPLVTPPELAILWWKRERHRLPQVWTETPDAPVRPERYEAVTLASGYTATSAWVGEVISRIQVERPRKRRPFTQRARAA